MTPRAAKSRTPNAATAQAEKAAAELFLGRLRSLLRDREMGAVARQAGVSREHMSRWIHEASPFNPQLGQIIRLSRALHVAPAHFLSPHVGLGGELAPPAVSTAEEGVVWIPLVDAVAAVTSGGSNNVREVGPRWPIPAEMVPGDGGDEAGRLVAAPCPEQASWSTALYPRVRAGDTLILDRGPGARGLEKIPESTAPAAFVVLDGFEADGPPTLRRLVAGPTDGTFIVYREDVADPRPEIFDVKALAPAGGRVLPIRARVLALFRIDP